MIRFISLVAISLMLASCYSNAQDAQKARDDYKENLTKNYSEHKYEKRRSSAWNNDFEKNMEINAERARWKNMAKRNS